MLFSVLPRGAIVAEMSNVGCRVKKKSPGAKVLEGTLVLSHPFWSTGTQEKRGEP